MKGVLIFTDNGIKLVTLPTCSNGAEWDKEGCFRYCNNPTDPQYDDHQADKLKWIAKLVDSSIKNEENWFKNKDNFKEVNLEDTNEIFCKCVATCKECRGINVKAIEGRNEFVCSHTQTVLKNFNNKLVEIKLMDMYLESKGIVK